MERFWCLAKGLGFVWIVRNGVVCYRESGMERLGLRDKKEERREGKLLVMVSEEVCCGYPTSRSS